MDLFTSLGNLVGADIPDSLDSRGMMPVFMGESNDGRKEIVIENQGKLGLRAGTHSCPLMPDLKPI